MTEPNLTLFGGTFDPPHRGHVAIAHAAAERFGLARILFTPVGRQPLKLETRPAPYADRLAMVALACRADPRFEPSELEAPSPAHPVNYTVDTLSRLAANHPRTRLFALVGADSFRSLVRWREPARLLELAEWIVVSRPGSTLADPEGMTLTSAQRARVHLLGHIHVLVSATDLRQRLHRREDCQDLLPPGVSEYIEQHNLYR